MRDLESRETALLLERKGHRKRREGIQTGDKLKDANRK